MKTWTCQRVRNGKRCQFRNPSAKRKCIACGKPRPPRRKPAHLAALQLDYEGFVSLNHGDHCGICQRAPSENRRLDRDHDHATGKPRGLLCHRCNRTLANWITPEWLEAAARYLRGPA